MKTYKHFSLSAITIIALNVSISVSYGQFTPLPGNTGLATNAPNQVVGIGNFPNLASVQAVLHVNSNLTALPTFINRGEVFRTDCPAANPTYWRMLRGGTLYGLLFNNTGSNDLTLQAPQGNLILKDAINQITLAELIELKNEVQELKILLAQVK